VVERRPYKPVVVGSTPTPPTTWYSLTVMAGVTLVLRYDDQEVSVEVTLSTDLPEMHRRVGLKRGSNPLTELGFQLTSELDEAIRRHGLTHALADALVKRAADRGILR
jgi:hypothetical protein